jgi:hypothetical protein
MRNRQDAAQDRDATADTEGGARAHGVGNPAERQGTRSGCRCRDGADQGGRAAAHRVRYGKKDVRTESRAPTALQI